jgi:DNA-binding FadR family transcriptional regulator
LLTLVEKMDELVAAPEIYRQYDHAFHDVVMRTSGNRVARAVVRALESQVVNTVRYMGESPREQCVASNRGHRRIYECIAAHDPSAAEDAMFTHITEAWVVRRQGPGEPLRLRR